MDLHGLLLEEEFSSVPLYESKLLSEMSTCGGMIRHKVQGTLCKINRVETRQFVNEHIVETLNLHEQD